MTRAELFTRLKAGRPGTKVLVKGTVRTLHENSPYVEIQFDGYSLWIPLKDISLPPQRQRNKGKVS